MKMQDMFDLWTHQRCSGSRLLVKNNVLQFPAARCILPNRENILPVWGSKARSLYRNPRIRIQHFSRASPSRTKRCWTLVLEPFQGRERERVAAQMVCRESISHGCTKGPFIGMRGRPKGRGEEKHQGAPSPMQPHQGRGGAPWWPLTPPLILPLKSTHSHAMWTIH